MRRQAQNSDVCKGMCMARWWEIDGGSVLLYIYAPMFEYLCLNTSSPPSLSPVLNKFEIGRASNYEFPLYKEDSGFYKALREKVGAYFKDNKINPKVCSVPI